MTALCGVARNFTQLFVARIGVGVGEAALSPAAYSMLSDYFPPNELPRALSLYTGAAHVGAGIALIAGGASERRQFLDRVLALSSRDYLRTLRQYRAAVDQRNAALRRGELDAAWAFDPLVSRFGAAVVTERLAWVDRYGPSWTATCQALGEPMAVTMRYRGHPELADSAAWAGALEHRRQRDLATGSTNVGPHRDDLAFDLGTAPLRLTGSTGQQRTAAIALKLCERDTLEATHGDPPALLLDDAFAELDRDRQERLAAQLHLGPDKQVFVTAPRADELPPGLSLPIFGVLAGRVTPSPDPVAA